jgi:hypothetical protein
MAADTGIREGLGRSPHGSLVRSAWFAAEGSKRPTTFANSARSTGRSPHHEAGWSRREPVSSI